jgi:outer membrane lipoprotein-sorting protein
VIRVRKLGVRARWAVPAGVVAAVGIVIAASAVASAQSGPSLPARSAAQLLADVAHAKPFGAFSATIQQTSNLGLPALPAAASQAAGAQILTSGQSASIWYADAQHIRVAVPVSAGESDLRLDGRSLWLWSSKTQTATHVVLPAHFSGLGDLHWHEGVSSSQPPVGPSAFAGSPLAAAKRLLAAIGPSTAVSVQRNVSVAGQPAYQLSVAPKASGSLIGKILIAIDASKFFPLRVQVFARGASTPAFAIGFTALAFGRPAMSNFAFTPPPGATVKTEKVPSRLPAGIGKLGPGQPGLGQFASNKIAMVRPIPAKFRLARLRLAKACLAKPAASARKCAALRVSIGRAYAYPVRVKLVPGGQLPKQAVRRIEQNFARSLPKNMSQAQRAKIIKGFDQQFSKGFMVPQGSSPVVKNLGKNAGSFFSVTTPGALGSPLAGLTGGARPTVIGKDWLSVIATPPSPALAAAVNRLLANPGSQQPPVVQQQSSSVSSAYSSTLTVSGPAGPDPAVLRALLLATKPVHGKWGSGRLLTTSLFSVLITSNGRVLAGAVTPAVLYRDVAAHAG